MRTRGFTCKRAGTALAVALALAAPGSAWAAGASPRIVGGQQSDEAQYPFVVSLQFGRGSSGIERHFCGGSLIDREWVLTAAHCVIAASPDDFDVVVGRTELTSTSGITRDVAQVVVHPAYGSGETTGLGPDVALVRLSEPVEGIEPVEPVRPEERRLWEPGDVAEVAGWGLTNEEGDLSDDLRAVAVEIQPDDVMSSPGVYGKEFVAEHMLGAGSLAGGQDSCQGDSGGPLFVRSGTQIRQIGIVSWGEGCAREDKPGIYTRLGEGPTRDFVDSLIPVRVDDLSVFEGGTAHLTATLPRPSTRPVTVEYALMSETAAVDEDFAADAGRVQIPAGATSASIPVRILGDRLDEGDETFRVAVASATNPSLTQHFARVTIVDDDEDPGQMSRR